MSGKLNKDQRTLVSSFIRVTNAKQKDAISCLKGAVWNLEPAINSYYSKNGAGATPSSKPSKALHDLYLKYEDKERGKIMADGIISFCEEIGVTPEDVVMFVICWYMDAKTMGEFTQEEFEGGLEEMEIDTVFSPVASLKMKIPTLRNDLNVPETFKQIYEYAFVFSCEENQKCLQLDVATSIWPLLITKKKWKYIDEWCAFLQEHHKRAVSRDTWIQLLDFVNTVGTDFKKYDPNSAWPYLIDEFVEHMEDK
jgi:DCN1-like protein 1/2